MASGPPPPERPAASGETEGPKLSGFVFVPRLGLRVAGSGTLNRKVDLSCVGSGCAGFDVEDADDDFDYDDGSSFVIGGDVLVHVIPQLRLGVGLLYQPSGKVKIQERPDDDDKEEAKVGGNLTGVIVAEGVIPVSPKVLILGRAFGGAMLLFQGDDLKERSDDMREDCKDSPLECHTDVTDPPFGPTLGVGAGVAVAVGPKVRLRGDLLYQWYKVGFGSANEDIMVDSLSDVALTADIEFKASGSRVLLLAGAEF